MEGWCCSHLFPWGQRDITRWLVATVQMAWQLRFGLCDRPAGGPNGGRPAVRSG
jgi:hypothetical protein